MASKTAMPLVPHEPFIVYRTVPTAVLKYQMDETGFSEPEGIIVRSQTPHTGVAIREELESTGGIISVVE